MPSKTLSLAPYPIAAPAKIVWAVLTDFDHYPEWNPFTTAIETSGKIGDTAVLTIPRNGKLTQQHMILEVMNPPHEIAWRMPGLIHSSLMSAYRVQRIEAIDPKHCTYATSDTFSGLLAPTLAKMTGDWVEKKFVAMAEALKQEAERRHEQCSYR